MKKFMTITGMICNQIGFGENIKNNLKETDIEIEQQVSKNNDSVKEKEIIQKNNLARKKNRILNKNIRYIPKKYFIILFILIILIIFVSSYIFEKKEQKLPGHLMTYQLKDQPFVENYEEMKNKKFFIRPNQDNRFFELFKEKEKSGKKTYEKYTKKTILFASFINNDLFFETIHNQLWMLGKKTIRKNGILFLPIDYKKLMDTLKDRYVFTKDYIIFFSDKGFEKMYYSDFDREKHKHQYLKNLTQEGIYFIAEFFSYEIDSKLMQLNEKNIDDIPDIINHLLPFVPKKNELELITKYIWSYENNVFSIKLFISHKEAESIDISKLGLFIEMFLEVFLKKTNIKLNITALKEKEINVNQETFFEIPIETIDLLKKELKDLVVLNDFFCRNIFDSKVIHDMIATRTERNAKTITREQQSEVSYQNKKAKLIERQDEKIKKYFRKNSIPAIMNVEINELPKIMKKCLLTLSELKSYCF